MSLIKNSFLYLGSAMVAKSLPFLLLPYLTRVVPPDQLGLASIISLVFSIYVAVVGSNSQTAVTRNYFKADGNGVLRTKTLWSAIVYNVVMCALALFLSILIAPKLVDSFGLEKYFIYTLPVMALFFSIYQLQLTVIRCAEQPFVFASHEILYSVLSASTIFLYLTFVSKNASYQYWSILISSGILCVVSLISIVRGYPRVFDWASILSIASLCAPQILHVISNIALSVGDRYLVKTELGLAAVGIYTTAYSMSMGTVFIFDAYLRSYSPALYKLFSSNDVDGLTAANRLLKKSAIFLIALSSISFLLLYFSYELIVGNKYTQGKFLLGYLIAGMFFQSLYKLLYPFLIEAKIIKRLVAINIFAAVANILFNIYMLPLFGLKAAAWATALSYLLILIGAVILLFQAKKFIKENAGLKPVSKC